MQGEPAPGGRAAYALPVFSGGLGLLLLAEASTLPLGQDYAALGPGFLVLVVGLALTGIGAALFWRIRRGATFAPEETEGADASAPVSLSGLALAGGAVFLPVVLMNWLGFAITAGLAYAGVTRAFGSTSPLWRDAAIGIVLGTAVWFAFSKLGVQLGPYFPMGR